jgi:hypothetical protein
MAVYSGVVVGELAVRSAWRFLVLHDRTDPSCLTLPRAARVV